LPDGIVENSAAVVPIKSSLAFFICSLLQGIESPDIVDRGSDALRKLPQGIKG
jgi:hypothetical protein